MKTIKTLLLIFTLVTSLLLASCAGKSCDTHVDDNADGACDVCGKPVPLPCETHLDSDMNSACDTCGQAISYITVSKALELCGEVGNITAERYYIKATVNSVTNQSYGAMTISDGTGSISVYGTYSADGSLTFPNIASVPRKGDTVALHCILQNYNGTKEVKNARLIGFTDNSSSFDSSKYTAATIAEAREAEKGTLVTVEGVVAAVTYSTGEHPAGVILVDGTQSIYVYDADLAGSVKVGNKVKIAAEKDYWILDKEVQSAEKFGYLGCNQLTDAYLINKDGGIHSFDTSWIPESTVMEILDTPVSEDITSSLYKVTALVVKDERPGFVNYYIDDLDGETGSYVYTQCNGSDFEWLNQYNGKICTVYLTAINAKSTATGCVFRFLPVAVEPIENFTFASKDVPAHVLKYYAMKQLSSAYSGDPALTLISSVSSELLGFTGAAVTYTSDNTDVVTFTANGDKVTMNCPGFGTAKITVTVNYTDSKGNSFEAEEELTVTVTEPVAADYITVAEAIAAAKGSDVTVKGIVGASLVNKVGFYLIDESGAVAVMLSSDKFKEISIGDEIILKGKRTANDGETQIYISDGEIIANLYGNNDLPENSYTKADIATVFASTDTTKVYVTSGTVVKVSATHFTNYYIADPNNTSNKLQIYSSGDTGLTWLDEYVGQTVTIELIMCNWNGRGYKLAVISVVTDDGKIISSHNFDSYGN